MRIYSVILYRQILVWMMTAFIVLGVSGCKKSTPTSLPQESETIEAQEISTEEAPAMGPLDVAVIPLEDVPEPDPSRIWRPGEEMGLQIQRVIKDPRDVPLERFLYFNTRWKSSNIQGIPSGVVEHWDAEEIRQRFEDDGHMAVAVYVRLRTTETRSDDPIYVIDPHQDPWRERDVWYPWSGLAVVDDESDLRLPCMPQQIADPGKEYTIPEADKKFDPASYLPPKPWYPEITPKIDPGEIREGWILCLAPDVPVEDVRIVRQFRDSAAVIYSSESIAWTKLSGSLMGDWILLENAEVIGWQKPDYKWSRAFDDVPAYRDEPNENSPAVYEGPVWLSVTMGRTFDFEYPPGTPTKKKMRFNLQFYFDGMEALLEEWDRVALKKKFDINVYSDPSPVSMYDDFAGFYEVQIRARDFWLNIAELPHDLESVWVRVVERGEPEIWRTVDPVWRLDLIDSTEEATSTDDLCTVSECYDLNRDVYDRIRGRLMEAPWEELDGQSPIIPFDQYAMGLRILGTTFTDDPILFSENGPELRLLDPDVYDDRMMIVEIESKYGGIGQFPIPTYWDVHCTKGNEIEYMGYLNSKPLQGSLDGVFGFSGLLNSELRGIARNAVLIGEIKGTCPPEDILIFKLNTGPAWRIQ